MSKVWLKTRLADVLTPVSREERVDASREYRLLGVRLDGQGPFLRETVLGTQTSANKLYKVATGDFIYSRLFAWRGAFGVIESELDGCYVSGEFPTFVPKPYKIDVRFLRYWFRLSETLSKVTEDCSGSTPLTRNRFKEQFFLALEIPLPPLAEQQRIVARIEALAAKITEARSLHQQAVREADVLHSRAASSILDEARWESRPLAEVLAETPRNGLSPKAEVATGGRPMLRINAVSSSPTRFVDLLAFKRVEVRVEEAEPFVLRDGDVFIVRYNGDINRVAKPAIFNGKTDAVFPDKLMRLRPRPELMTPDFLVYALGCRRVRQQIEEMGKTTAGQIGVSGADAKAFIVPIPPVSEQYRIVEYLDGLQAKVDSLKHLQTETSAELDALLPAILDRAFRGEI
jgi:type I restriction enzyme S subunit